MDVFTMVVALVAIGTVGKLIGRWLNGGGQSLAARQQGAATEQALRQEIAALRDRVATLERIVTDPAYDLKRQIQALETRRAA